MGRQLRQELDNAAAGAKCWCWPVMAASAIALAWVRFRNARCCWCAFARTPRLCYRALASEHGGARRFYGTGKFTPEQVRQDKVAHGKPPRSFREASAARSAIKKWPRCTGSAGPNSVPFVSSSSRRLPIARAKTRSCTTAIRRTCRLRICAVRPSSYYKFTSTGRRYACPVKDHACPN